MQEGAGSYIGIFVTPSNRSTVNPNPTGNSKPISVCDEALRKLTTATIYQPLEDDTGVEI